MFVKIHDKSFNADTHKFMFFQNYILFIVLHCFYPKMGFFQIQLTITLILKIEWHHPINAEQREKYSPKLLSLIQDWSGSEIWYFCGPWLVPVNLVTDSV